jgi:hypothetical protein
MKWLHNAIHAAAGPRTPSIRRRLLGWVCIILGVPGLILPLLPGIPLLVMGIVLLSREHHWAHRLLVWAKARFRSLPFMHLHDHEPHPPAKAGAEKPLRAEEKP